MTRFTCSMSSKMDENCKNPKLSNIDRKSMVVDPTQRETASLNRNSGASHIWATSKELKDKTHTIYIKKELRNLKPTI